MGELGVMELGVRGFDRIEWGAPRNLCKRH